MVQYRVGYWYVAGLFSSAPETWGSRSFGCSSVSWVPDQEVQSSKNWTQFAIRSPIDKPPTDRSKGLEESALPNY